MHPIDTDACSDADTKIPFPFLQTPTRTTSTVFIVKTLASGGTTKYCACCDPNATLSDLRVILQNDEDHIMCLEDRFHRGEYRVGKGSEPQMKWRDILEGEVIGIGPKDMDLSRPSTIDSPSSTKGQASSTKPNSPSSSSLPPATVPLHRMTKHSWGDDQLYGNYENEKDGHCLSWVWKYEGLVCRIWEKQAPGMVPFRRLWIPSAAYHCFVANDEDANYWINEHQAMVEFTVGYVYRRDGPCPDGAVPLYHVYESKLGRLLTISESERSSCVLLGAKDEGTQCYVAPP